MDQTIQPKKKWYKKWWAIVLFGVIAVVVLSSFGGPDTSNTASNLSNIPRSGEEGYLRVEGGGIVTLIKTKELYDQFSKSMLAKDTYGMAKMVQDGGGFNVPVGTKVLVIDNAFGLRRVRVLEGEHTMDDGWVAMEFVSKQ